MLLPKRGEHLAKIPKVCAMPYKAFHLIAKGVAEIKYNIKSRHLCRLWNISGSVLYPRVQIKEDLCKASS